MATTFSISQIGRIVLVLYQYRILNVTGIIWSDLPLIIASTWRLFVYCCAVCLLASVVSERIYATYFIVDYEKKRRIWLEIAHLAFSIIPSAATAWLFTSFSIHYKFYVFACAIAAVICGILWQSMTFFVLFYYNRRKLKSLLQTFEQRKYSLSVRFQYEENIRAFELLKPAIVIHGVFCIFAMTAYSLPILFYPMGAPEIELSICIFEGIANIYVIGLLLGMIHRQPIWRRKFVQKLSFIRRSVVEQEEIVKHFRKPEETEIYFRQLRNSWSK
ncbi:unnamed protein product, partial [Mesorhabditis belari]|uniref:Uncharacterized protein n=1 Tax=Mesorhabditis belari TaxID=2138241 RepID=A0AAF3FRN9_9BILA